MLSEAIEQNFVRATLLPEKEPNSARRPRRRHRTYRGRLPHYHYVVDALREQLATGVLPAGVKLPSLRELAERFKFSTNTVRKAIRVMEAEGWLYHVPAVGAFAQPAHPTASATQVSLALVTIDIGGAFEMEIARGVEQACQEREWGLQILDARADAGLEARNLGRLAHSGTRGAIIMPISDPVNLERLVQLKLSGYPIVLIDRGVPGLLVDLVESDHEQGAYMATDYLIRHGHQRIYMLTDPPMATSITSRIHGFERALIEHGRDLTRRMLLVIDRKVASEGLRQGKRWLGGFEAAITLLREVELPVAVFAHNDYSAWGVFEACRELNLRIPEDVSIIGFDDSEITRAMTPALTTIAQRTLEIGREAVEFLSEYVQNPGAGIEPRHVRVPVELVERGSVARLISVL